MKESQVNANSFWGYRTRLTSIWLLSAMILFQFGLTALAESLGNEKIKVEFDKYGLSSVHDQILNKTLKLGNDNWSIAIDGKIIDSSGLKPKKITKGQNSLNYLYNAGRFTIEVVYELKPDWRFVSKQMFVTDNENGQYNVDSVTIFQAKMKTDVEDQHVIQTAWETYRTHHGHGDCGVFLRFDKESWGAFVLAQNPFLKWQMDGSDFSLSYKVDMEWKSPYGPFKSDRGMIGTYKLIGQKTSPYMPPHPEWLMDVDNNHEQTGMDLAEVNAYIDCVRQFLLYNPDKSLRVHVPWCENDYKIDIATADGEAQFKRIVDMCSDLNIGHMLYTVRNTEIATRAEATDAWNWGHLLWLNMGPKIEKDEWDPKTDSLPEKTIEMIKYAERKNIKLMAYVYPTMAFQQNKEWLTPRNIHRPDWLSANVGFRSFQDWLIENLVAFKRRTGISGYSFDYWPLTLAGSSNYAQWYGCRRVLEELRIREPDIVLDGRQSYHNFGPWTWLAGNYPHPTAGDEQPESFQPFPDLHFDRSSATHQRYTAYWFRNTQFCPVEIMPGFITHQTPRRTAEDRARDWDYLGWKFSLFSSIATAPLSHCFDMIPARDFHEFTLFSQADKDFINYWTDWTDENAQLLKEIKSIIGPPTLGCVDGSAAIKDGHGFIFLFNPNHRKLNAEFTLDETIGLNGGDKFVLKELYPHVDKLIGNPDAGTYSYGDKVSLKMDGAAAMVLELNAIDNKISDPMLFNASGQATLEDSKLTLSNVKGETGTSAKLQVVLPEHKNLKGVLVNGADFPFTKDKDMVTIDAGFAGAYFPHAQQIGTYDPQFSGHVVRAKFKIPQRIFDQLNARKKAWPIPWEKSDYECTWLVPERLLLYIQIAEPDMRMNVNATINDARFEVKKAFSSITPDMLRSNRGNNTFTGFYIDLSPNCIAFDPTLKIQRGTDLIIHPDKEYEIELTLPSLKPGQFQGMFFENIETEYTTEIQ